MLKTKYIIFLLAFFIITTTILYDSYKIKLYVIESLSKIVSIKQTLFKGDGEKNLVNLILEDGTKKLKV